jgi:hypothetical protein
LSLAAEERCARAHDRLSRLIAEGRHVYGLTTGFGPLANRLVGSGNGVALRQNLILPAAHAVTVLDDDFSSYGPTTVLNATDGVFGGVWETVDGTVDYLRTGFSDLCRDGAPCVDLDGSTRNAGVFRTVQAFGEGSYRLSFRLFGSGRGDTNAVTVSLALSTSPGRSRQPETGSHPTTSSRSAPGDRSSPSRTRGATTSVRS